MTPLLLGIDVGTSGCKAGVFDPSGRPRAEAYEEYNLRAPQPGWAELDSREVWDKVKSVIRRAAAEAGGRAIRALSVSSLGEAVVPLTRDRRILGPSIVCFDPRGESYLPRLAAAMPNDRLYRLNGNTLGNPYSLTKLLWTREHAPELYGQTDVFLHWSGTVSFLLGAEPVTDFSLANRTLLFDVDRGGWSDELLAWSGLDRDKLPRTAPSGTAVGTVSRALADELGLAPDTLIAAGAHDQCANAVGGGVIAEGQALWGLGTFLCMTPVFRQRRAPDQMMPLGLNTEHHAAPGLFVSFLYNQSGALVKWFRDTFAAADKRLAAEAGRNIYDALMAELPPGPSRVMALPHFTATGPPEFTAESSGVLAGLRLDTTRGEVLKGLMEGATFYIKVLADGLARTGVEVADFRAAGGGSRADAWVQLSADILGRPFRRPAVTEAGTLGAAILAGTAAGIFSSLDEGVAAMVRLDRTFDPDPARHARYAERFAKYQALWPLLRDYLRNLG
jgi:xylulokinase